MCDRAEVRPRITQSLGCSALFSGETVEAGGREGHCAFRIILKVRTPAATSSAALDSLHRASG